MPDTPQKPGDLEREIAELRGQLEDLEYVKTKYNTLKETYRENEHRFQMLADNLSDIIWILDAEFKFTFVSKMVKYRFGYEPEEVIGASLENFLSVSSYSTILNYYEEDQDKLLSSPLELSITRTMQIEFRHRDGHYILTEVTVSVISSTNGIIEGFLGIARDITDRNRAESALKESESKYRAIFDSTSDGMFIFDYESGQLLDVNPCLCDMLGYDRDDLLATPCLELIADDQILPGRNHTPAKFLDLWLAIRDQSFFKEWHAKRKDGHEFWVDFSLKPVTIDNKKRVLAVVRDITERREAENALKESELKYRTIFNSANDAIFIHDFDTGEIVDVNDKAAQMYGYTKNELISSNNLKITTAEQLARFKELNVSQSYEDIWRKTIKDNLIFEWHARHKDGHEFWVEVNLKEAILGGLKRIIAIVRDITERKEALEAIKERDIRLRRFVEDAGDAIMSVDVEGRIILASKRVADYVGMSINELAGKSLVDVFAKEINGVGIDEMKQAIRENKPFYREYPVVYKGENRWYRIMVKPMSRVAGSKQVAHVIATDFTESVRVRVRDQARITMLNNLRIAKSIDDCLMCGCQAIYDSQYYKRAVITIHNEKREIVNIGYIGLDKAIIEQARRGKAPDDTLRQNIMQEKYRISRSYFIPVEAGLGIDKSERYISSVVENFEHEYSWKNGDEFFVPILSDDNLCEGWLSVDTPFDDRRPTAETAMLLEEIIEIVTKKVHEISSLQTLKRNSVELEESNIALRAVLANYERDKAEIKGKISRFISDILLPAAERLSNPDNSLNRAQYSILKTGLLELILSPDIAIQTFPQLSPREIEISSMIKDGYSSKEIAVTLNIALKTVHKHRQIIRRKLGIGKQKINIRTFLSNHQLFSQKIIGRNVNNDIEI
jgi:PAS domain S-box-containing protein